MHTAIRTKVPFKKKVRGQRSSKSKTASTSKSKSKSTQNKTTTSGLMQAAAIATGSTNHAFKRQSGTADDTTKLTKKKKRSTTTNAVVANDEQASKLQSDSSGLSKSKKLQTKTKPSSKHKEIIDYSMRSPVDNTQTTAMGKVEQWLLDSPVAQQSIPMEQEHITKTRQMNKSQSTPERLALRAPKKVKSVSNLNDKVKLQVVYKPPFKFSLRLSKNSAVKTKVIGGTAAELARSKRKSRTDKTRTNRDSVAIPNKNRRSALLIRSKVTDEVDGALSFNLKTNSSNNDDRQQLMPQEPNYETLTPKKDSLAYENLKNSAEDTKRANKQEPINTATFRINKSASGPNINGHTNKLFNTNSSPCNTTGSKSSGSRGSSNNLSKIGNGTGHSARDHISHKNPSNRSSTTNLSKQFGSSQNLMRSSTTNLSKANTNRNSFDIKRGFYDMSRSSTTNLSKDRRHGSHLNLLKHQHLRGSSSNMNSFEDIALPATFASTTSSGMNNGRMRRNSSTIKSSDSLTKTSIPRVPSNSNLKMPSLRHGGSTNNNIPRASLNFGASTRHNPQNVQPAQFMRQTSLQPQPVTSKINATIRNSDQYLMRPHTAECNVDKKFEWSPTMLTDKKTKIDEPLPSDLEVMVSDVENLVNDDN